MGEATRRQALRLRHDPDGPSWSMVWGGTRFDIRVHGEALICDYFGPDRPEPPPPLWVGWREHDLLVNARLPALVEMSRRSMGVPWRLDGWHRPDPETLAIVLRAEEAELRCQLSFRVDRATGMLLRRTELLHTGPPDSPPLRVGGALSLWLTLRGRVREARFLSGEWGAEGQAGALPGGHAALLLDSRAGKTGFEFQPWVALLSDGSVYLCQLLWSGNWTLEARMRRANTTLSGGLNEWGFEHALQPGELLALPEVVLGHVQGDLEQATRRLHDWRRARRPDPDRPVPVQFNTWYALDEDVDEASVLALIPPAAALGCEVFVLDAGWYTTRDHDPAADWFLRTGDWVVDPERFPRGLAPLRAACAAAGMGFGIWCEPEAVGPRAALRRTHPQWLHHLDGRPPPPEKRAVLHLGVPEAWAHALATLSRLVEDTGAAWLKWDFNADLGAGGWSPDLPAALSGQDPLVAHVQGLYRLQAALRARFPHLVLEMCASGAGRMDGAILAQAHTNWLSDQPQAVAKLAIHMGMQRAHPAVCCNDWLVDWPPRTYSGVAGIDRRGDLAFRLRVAMLGSFGLSAPLAAWSAAERAEAAAHVALYRARLRPLIQHGDQYLLTEPPPIDGEGDWAAVWYVAKDGRAGALFAFRLAGGPESRAFPLPGLRPGPWRIANEAEAATVDANGVRVILADPFRSVLVVLDAT